MLEYKQKFIFTLALLYQATKRKQAPKFDARRMQTSNTNLDALLSSFTIEFALRNFGFVLEFLSFLRATFL